MDSLDRQKLTALRAQRDFLEGNERLLLELVDRLEAKHDALELHAERLELYAERRITELLEANNREVERRRAATAALRRVRQRITGTVVDGEIFPFCAWRIEVALNATTTLAKFIDAAIARAEGNG
jgi:hypothetical protein